MYLPKPLRVTDWNIVQAVIEENSFVDMIGILDGGITVTKTPIILAQQTVQFHIARGNELLQVIKATGKLTMLVNGPNAYISPTYYRSATEVPTWNYIFIQCQLSAQVITDPAWYLRHHQALVEKFERHGWKNELPEAYRAGLFAAMIGVEARIESFTAKFKIGQDYSDEDFRGVHRALLKKDPGNRLAKWMAELFAGKLSGANSAE